MGDATERCPARYLGAAPEHGETVRRVVKRVGFAHTGATPSTH